MEAIAAFSLAANVVQFVDFGFKLFSQGNELRYAGRTDRHVDLELIAQSLEVVSQKVKDSLRAHDERLCLTAVDNALDTVAESCLQLSYDLRSALQNLRTEPDKGRWRSFAHALRVSWSAEKVDRLLGRLTSLRDQLEIQVLFSLKQDTAAIKSMTAERFDALDADVRVIISAIIDGKTFFNTALEEQTRVLVEQHKLSNDLAEMRHRQTLAAITQRGNESERAQFERTAERLDATALAKLREEMRSIAEKELVEMLYFQQKFEREDDVAATNSKTFEWIFASPEESRAQEVSISQRSTPKIHELATAMSNSDTTTSIEDGKHNDNLPEDMNAPATRLAIDSENNFVEWLRSGSGCYWINGKAGSGKSTLMKYISKHEETQKSLSVWASPHDLQIAAFYFWNNGTELQKSQEGLLRTLLHTVFKNSPELVYVCFQSAINTVLAKIEQPTQRPRFVDDLTYNDLRKGFSILLKQRSAHLRLCLFIDGLDEYDGEVSELCELFKRAAQTSMLKIVLSSRPIPACIEAFQASHGFRLQDLTRPDIQMFVEDSLGNHSRMKALQLSEPHETYELIAEIVEKASGVFLWVVLVTKSLLNGLSNFDRVDDLRKRLDALPRQLHDLYKHMLSSMDPLYRTQASRLLQIVYQRIIARMNRTLTTLQLSFDDSDPTDAFKKKRRDLTFIEKLLRCQDMEGRLRSRCCGLVEVQAREKRRGLDASIATLAQVTGINKWKWNELLDSEVQFLHRTVVDFLRDPEIWQFVISLCEAKDFDVNVSLLGSCVSFIKSSPTEKRVVVAKSLIWRTMRDALFYAARAEETTGNAQTLYVDELNYAMEYHWNAARQWQRDNAPTQDLETGSRLGDQPFWYEVEGDWTCTVDYAGRTTKHADNFISLAVSQRLTLYLEDKLKRDSASIIGVMDRQLLLQIVRCVAVDQYVNFDQQLTMMNLLFSYGSDPNAKQCDESSTWAVVVTYLGGALALMNAAHVRRWIQVLESFLRAGADVNVALQSNIVDWASTDRSASRQVRNLVFKTPLAIVESESVYQSNESSGEARRLLCECFHKHNGISKTWVEMEGNVLLLGIGNGPEPQSAAHLQADSAMKSSNPPIEITLHVQTDGQTESSHLSSHAPMASPSSLASKSPSSSLSENRLRASWHQRTISGTASDSSNRSTSANRSLASLRTTFTRFRRAKSVGPASVSF